jgi:transcriptional regulator GlxA family with amidase domain
VSPKYYPRIFRVKKSICFLLHHKNINLVDVAQQFGFSDQAHMTKERRSIACITLGQV